MLANELSSPFHLLLSFIFAIVFISISSFSIFVQCARHSKKEEEEEKENTVRTNEKTPTKRIFISASRTKTKGTDERDDTKGKSKTTTSCSKEENEPIEKKNQSGKPQEPETDSFSRHVPRVRESKRSKEIKSKPPVRSDRDDYKTIPAHQMPSSSAFDSYR